MGEFKRLTKIDVLNLGISEAYDKIWIYLDSAYAEIHRLNQELLNRHIHESMDK